MATIQAEQAYSGQVPRTASSATLPPSYDALISNGAASKPQPSSSELPPPTYDEAMYLFEDEKYNVENKTENVKQQTSQINSDSDNSKP